MANEMRTKITGENYNQINQLETLKQKIKEI